MSRPELPYVLVGPIKIEYIIYDIVPFERESNQ